MQIERSSTLNVLNLKTLLYLQKKLWFNDSQLKVDFLKNKICFCYSAEVVCAPNWLSSSSSIKSKNQWHIPLWPWSLTPSLDSLSWVVTALTLITGKLIGLRRIIPSGWRPRLGASLYIIGLTPSGLSTPNSGQASLSPLLSGFALTLFAPLAGVRLYRNHWLERLCKYRDHSFQIKSARTLKSYAEGVGLSLSKYCRKKYTFYKYVKFWAI